MDFVNQMDYILNENIHLKRKVTIKLSDYLLNNLKCFKHELDIIE